MARGITVAGTALIGGVPVPLDTALGGPECRIKRHGYSADQSGTGDGDASRHSYGALHPEGCSLWRACAVPSWGIGSAARAKTCSRDFSQRSISEVRYPSLRWESRTHVGPSPHARQRCSVEMLTLNHLAVWRSG